MKCVMISGAYSLIYFLKYFFFQLKRCSEIISQLILSMISKTFWIGKHVVTKNIVPVQIFSHPRYSSIKQGQAGAELCQALFRLSYLPNAW